MKKHERRRLITQAVSFAFSNGYVAGFTGRAGGSRLYEGRLKSVCVPGLNCYSCPGAVGACPIGSLQAVLGSGTFRLSLYVFGFLGLLGMLFGRLICGWICPFGFIQELLYKIPGVKKRKNLPGHNRLLRLKYVLLALLILIPFTQTLLTGYGSPAFCAWICPAGTLLGGLPQLLIDPALRAAAGIRFAVKLAILLIVLFLAVISYRPFCKYVCPLGALYSLFNPVSLYRYTVDANKCIGCGTCRTVCGMDIDVREEPNARECIRCGRCKSACPQKAISSSKEAWEARLTAPRENNTHKEKRTVSAVKRPILLLAAAVLLGGLFLMAVKLKKEPAPVPVATAVPQTSAAPETPVFTVFCHTADGTPVPDVQVQVCSASLCRVYRSDENGLIAYDGLPGLSYEVTLIRAPQGFTCVSDRTVTVSGQEKNTDFIFEG